MMRRGVLLAGLVVLVASSICTGLALAQSQSQQVTPVAVSVVKVVSLSCPVCRESEVLDSSIRAAVESTGGKMAYATVPPEPSQNGRELLYYAVRAVYPEMETQVRESLFKASQDRGYDISDLTQLMVWFEQDMPDYKFDYKRIAQALQSGTVKDAYARALRVTVASGVKSVPAYVVLTDRGIVGAFEITGGDNKYSDLRNSVLRSIQQNQSRGS